MTNAWLATVLVPVRNYGLAEGEQCWEVQHIEYRNKRQALAALAVGMESGAFHPIAAQNKDGAWGVFEILQMLGYVFSGEPCMDHGMPAPWCRCGEAA